VARLLTLVASALFIPEFVLLFAGPLLLFPTGRLPSPRWRWVVVSAATGVGLAMMSMLLAPGYVDDDVPARGSNPLGVEALDGVTDMLEVAGLVLVLGSVLMAVAAVVVRLVRYRGARRRQMWWFLSGIAPLVVGLAFDPGSSPAAQTVAALVIFGALLGGMGWALLGTPARAVHDEETETLRVSRPTRFQHRAPPTPDPARGSVRVAGWAWTAPRQHGDPAATLLPWDSLSPGRSAGALAVGWIADVSTGARRQRAAAQRSPARRSGPSLA
jgi:uncharacterized membrane protein YhaH (DUF805 family)